MSSYQAKRISELKKDIRVFKAAGLNFLAKASERELRVFLKEISA